MLGEGRTRQGGPGLLVGYLPLVVVGVVITAMVWLVPSNVPESTAGQGNVVEGVVAETASGWGAGVQPCEDRELQVDKDYSPPCFTFTGDNGGATHVGVSEDTISVSYRHLADGHLLETLALLAGQSLGESPEDLWRTADGLADYFNENFEFYGRTIQLERFDGTGTLVQELLGAGQEQANVDARRATDRGVFADISATTQPYAEALVDQGVVAIGAPYMSREWYSERAPYAWSIFPDCTYVAEVATEIGNEHLFSEPAALAGGALEGEPRTLGIVYPNNEEYVRCGETAQDRITAAGYDVASVQNYTLDLAQTSANADAVLSRLKDANITSVACGCDPLMVQALAQRAEQQNYHPEWLILGVGFVDLDLVGQIISSGSGDQWSRSFGATPSVEPLPFGESQGYRAFKSTRPDEEPSQMVDMLYGAFYRLAIGIQMAGPDLTPDNYGTGMFNYPQNSGELGMWDFSPTNFSGVADARFVYWRMDEPSPFNGEPGTYGDSGDRFTEPSDAPSQSDLLEMIREEG